MIVFYEDRQASFLYSNHLKSKLQGKILIIWAPAYIQLFGLHELWDILFLLATCCAKYTE